MYLAGVLLARSADVPGLGRTQLVSQPEIKASWTSPAAVSSPVMIQQGKGAFEWVSLDTERGDAIQISRSGAGESGVKFAVKANVFEDSISFCYWIPKTRKPVELQLSLWTENGKKEFIAHIDPARERWVQEEWKLSDVIGGDVRRMNPKLRETVAVGIRADSSLGLTWKVRDVLVRKLPNSPGPMTIPSQIRIEGGAGMVQIAREFTVDQPPSLKWAQVIAKTPWKVWLNDKVIATSEPFAAQQALWPDLGSPAEGSWRRAADVNLNDLVKGRNILKIEAPEGSPVIFAAGWQEWADVRVVLVSDGQWKSLNGGTIKLEAIESSSQSIVDIYPLRLPVEWAPLESVKNVSWQATKLKSPLLAPRVIAGKWTLAQFPQHGNRWFLRDPKGEPFFALGSQTLALLHENYGYYRHVTAQWPSEEQWTEHIVQSIKGMGFNTVAVASTWRGAFDQAGKAGMPGFHFIGSAVKGPFVRDAKGNVLDQMPDPWDESWRKSFRQAAESKAALWNPQPNIIGFFVNNEMPMDGNIFGRTIVGYVYSDACGKQFVAWLKQRYAGDIQKLNATWYGTNSKRYHQSFEAILTDKPDPAPFQKMWHIPGLMEAGNGPVEVKKAFYGDFHAFAARAMQEYAGYMLQVLREVMPTKIIGTNRFQGGADEAMLMAWKDYDLIAWNAYPIWDERQEKYTRAQLDAMSRAFKLTGKPLLITEWGSATYEARLPGTVVSFAKYQEQGEGYGQVLRQLYELPFVVGAIHFAWQDLADSERQAWGIVDSYGRPREEFVRGIVKAHEWLDSQFLSNKEIASESGVSKP